jgi:hypothetical protein
MLFQARDMAANSWRDMLDLVKGGMRDKDGDQRRPVEHWRIARRGSSPTQGFLSLIGSLYLCAEMQNAPRRPRGARNSLPTALTQHRKPTQWDDSCVDGQFVFFEARLCWRNLYVGSTMTEVT